MKTKVTVTCVADKYAGHNERIIEFHNRDADQGGLISFVRNDDGNLVVSLYRLDENVVVVCDNKHLPQETTA